MNFTKKQIKEMIEYWRDTADNDWGTAQSLWRSKRYDACLFYCHLVLEKLLKGLIIQKTNEVPPYTHDLVELIKKADINIKKEEIKELVVFTSFNIRCRYPQDKLAFYKLCTDEFSEPYFRKAKKLVLWLEKFYQKNK